MISPRYDLRGDRRCIFPINWIGFTTINEGINIFMIERKILKYT